MASKIEEYFKITGRPIATMTVAEYLAFCEYDQKYGRNICITPDNQPVIQKTKPVTHENKEIQNSETGKATNKPVSKPAKTNKSALDMLRSVSG